MARKTYQKQQKTLTYKKLFLSFRPLEVTCEQWFSQLKFFMQFLFNFFLFCFNYLVLSLCEFSVYCNGHTLAILNQHGNWNGHGIRWDLAATSGEPESLTPSSSAHAITTTSVSYGTQHLAINLDLSFFLSLIFNVTTHIFVHKCATIVRIQQRKDFIKIFIPIRECFFVLTKILQIVFWESYFGVSDIQVQSFRPQSFTRSFRPIFGGPESRSKLGLNCMIIQAHF